MNIAVIDTFIDKFKYLWQSGLDAHLFVDTKAGQAWCRLDVRLGHAPGPLHQQLHPQPGPRRDGPARRRRRERRALARAALAAGKADSRPSQLAEKADSTLNLDVINETGVLLAEEADVLVNPAPPNHAAHVCPPPLPIQDELCSDKEYREREEIVLSTKFNQIQEATSDAILAPISAMQDEYEKKTDAQLSALEHQLEFLSGFLKQRPSISQPTAKNPCNMCGKTFETERALRNHVRIHLNLQTQP